jgi:hypothetical protein
MSDGYSFLTRLPYPLTLSRHVVVASEVATLDALRADVILAYRFLAYLTGEDAVGAQSMLMERMPAKQLSYVLYSLSDKERYRILH